MIRAPHGSRLILDVILIALLVPTNPWLNAVNPVKQILAVYLINMSNVDVNTKEQVINYTFGDDEGIFRAFINNVEQRIFDEFKGLPTYEWDLKAKKNYLQAASQSKGASCSRNEHVVALYEHLVRCDRFFWRVNKVIKVVAEERMKEMNEEVVDMLALVNRVCVLENKQNNLKFQQSEVNKALDLHEGELINHATNTRWTGS